MACGLRPTLAGGLNKIIGLTSSLVKSPIDALDRLRLLTTGSYLAAQFSILGNLPTVIHIACKVSIAICDRRADQPFVGGVAELEPVKRRAIAV